MITFEKNVPLAKKKNWRERSGSIYREVVQNMEIWDSYLFKDKKIVTVSANVALYKWDRMFTARTVEWGVRVWRIS